MSYISNQYNYATPLSSTSLFTEKSAAVDKAKYFTLYNNVLDGTYTPIVGDVGLWGEFVSDASGVLPTPLRVTITEDLTINAFKIEGSPYSYPVDFSVEFYNGNSLLQKLSVTDNTEVAYTHYFNRTFTVTSILVSVTKVSNAGGVAKLLSVYNPAYVKRVDNLKVAASENTEMSQLFSVYLSDTIKVSSREGSYIRNTINPTKDTLKVLQTDSAELLNVHSIMKSPTRRIYGKVYITYTDPMLESDTSFDYSSVSYNSHVEQLTDSVHETDGLYFTLYDNDLTGKYKLSDSTTQVGWTSAQLSNADGAFEEDVWVAIAFQPRPVKSFIIAFDESHGNIVKDFVVILTTTDFEIYNYEYKDNDQPIITVTTDASEIQSITVLIRRVAKPFSPATILSLPLSSTLLYKGYEDESNLMSIDLLEELTYEDDIEALGGVSANEVTVTLDNSKKDFYFNNYSSLVASQLKRNRKIVPWLGVEVQEGLIEWYTLGTFWSYKWDVPVNGLTAKVVGFDTIGLLDTTTFTNHVVLKHNSIAQLIRYVLEDAKQSLPFITYSIDAALEDIIIPYAWFEPKSHTAALRKISGCFPMHIYCDRKGCIQAAPQKLKVDYYYDTWSDSTNVIEKTYPTLHTTLPNIVNVTVNNPLVITGEKLAEDDTVLNVPVTRTVTFNKPFVDNLVLTIDCDDTVEYTYAVYSWGTEITFTGTGQVRSVTCVGDAVDISNSSITSYADAESVRYNGSVTRDIESDFIQTNELANILINRIKSLSADDKYDASVEYRGDIALSINDPILLKDGIAPSDKYNIKRHQLYWDGSLSGSAELNT